MDREDKEENYKGRYKDQKMDTKDAAALKHKTALLISIIPSGELIVTRVVTGAYNFTARSQIRNNVGF